MTGGGSDLVEEGSTEYSIDSTIVYGQIGSLKQDIMDISNQLEGTDLKARISALNERLNEVLDTLTDEITDLKATIIETQGTQEALLDKMVDQLALLNARTEIAFNTKLEGKDL
jgi:predicted  nucleic acid-binding Zn-ribbon protein